MVCAFWNVMRAYAHWIFQMHRTTRKKNQEGHKMKLHVKLASLVFIACSVSALAEPSYEDIVKMKYCFSEWGGATKAYYSHRLKRVPLDSLVMPTNGMEISVKHMENRLLVFSKGKTMVDVCASARESVAAAHDALIDRFSLMTSTTLMSPSQSIGDVCFVETNESYSCVVFARNNVDVHVHSRSRLISAMNIATQIDRNVVEASIIPVSTRAADSETFESGDSAGTVSDSPAGTVPSGPFSCLPKDLPTNEVVTISCTPPGELYEVLFSGELLRITSTNYPACEIAGHQFMLHGHDVSAGFRDGQVMIAHRRLPANDGNTEDGSDEICEWDD